MELQRQIWDVLKDMCIGSKKDPWKVHTDAQQKYIYDHRLCLVVKGLNPDHQNPKGIKLAMPGSWGLIGRVEGQVTDDGLVKFFFQKEHHMLTVLDKAPYNYRGWMVAVDLWSRRFSPTFLRSIPFRIRIDKLPADYRRLDIIKSIGEMHGHVVDTQIIEPNFVQDRPAQVWVQVEFDVDHQITTVRKVDIMPGEPPVELEFSYKGLQKLCATCGSLRHAYDKCPMASTLSTTAGALMEIGHDPYVTTEERQVAVVGINTGHEIGENTETGSIIPPALIPLTAYLIEEPAQNEINMIEATGTDEEYGLKRTSAEAQLEDQLAEAKRFARPSQEIYSHNEASTSTASRVSPGTITEATTNGLVVATKPPVGK
ncbi:hypothetical protein AALP_AAs41215U000100 [Arabis alpina]|uniref:DUF4283 domain-containing protein n=1 Tax=Arabis alpina TaxID=50452 RepID=A0A087G2H6_ARAAL|nr:hypothetical protein AALP_AAs41215U000100 [Arabis alpina]